MTQRVIRTLAASAIAVAMVGAVATTSPTTVIADSASADSNARPALAGLPQSFADLVEQVSPAVVNISVSATVDGGEARGPGGNSPFQGDPRMEEFYKRFFNEQMPQQRQGAPKRQARAVGSGFIIDPEGFVVTNHHVIDNATEVTVVLADGREYPAEVKGSDPKTDLALLKVKADVDLPYVQFGNSETSRVGDWVIAIGNPFGLGGTTTTGIISARGRDINSSPLDDFIQVDAAINRGNSGGPLFATDGSVIGVNTAIYSPNGGSVGIGFAVPSEQASRIIAQLKDSGGVTRGWLGVQIQSLNKDLADSLGLENTDGALVADVVDGSPAQAGGIKTGDVIKRFDGADVTKMRNLPKLVARTAPGTGVPVEVVRDGKSVVLNIQLEKSEDSKQLASAPPAKGELGLTLSNLDGDLRARFGIDSNTTGVVVIDVDSAGKAAEKGVRPGDLIVAVGGESVSSTETISEGIEAARAANRASVLLRISRDGRERFVALPVA